MTHPNSVDHVVVRYRPGKAPALNEGARSKGLPELRTEPFLQGENLSAALERLNSNPDVLYAEPDFLAQTLSATHTHTPSDPELLTMWAIPKISAPAAWDITTGSPSVKICVVDTGVDYTHPDLAANVLPGYNAITGQADAMDDNGHGTHVAGIIGAVGDNNEGITGLNWNVGILPCKFMSAAGAGYLSDAIECMFWCRDQGAAISSHSWRTTGYSQALYDTMEAIGAEGHLFVTAAGNNGADNDYGTSATSYPAAFNLPYQITVSATDSNDVLSSWSSYGAATAHLAAPGVNIFSTGTTADDQAYIYRSGTSMAAAHVSGAAALIKSVRPDFTPSQIKVSLLSNTDTAPSLAGKVVSSGRLNVNRAVRAAAQAMLPSMQQKLRRSATEPASPVLNTLGRRVAPGKRFDNIKSTFASVISTRR